MNSKDITMYKIIKTIKFGILLGVFSVITPVKAQSLEDYVQKALQNSSAIKKNLLDEQISLEKISEADFYPDFQVKTGIFLLQPETRVGNQVFKVGVSQKIPWFGSNKAHKDWLSKLAEQTKFDTQITQRQIVYQLKIYYYKIYEKQKSIRVLQENKQVLDTYETLATSALSNNRANMADVLSIQVKKNEIEAKIFKYNNDLKVLKAKFNRLLEQDINTPVNTPNELNIREIVLQTHSITQHPGLNKIDFQNDIFDKKAIWIKKTSYPKVVFGIDYTAVSPIQNKDITRNGKDILMPQIGVSIPLFNKKYSAQLQQIQLNKEQIKQLYTEQEKQLNNALDEAFFEIENQQILLETSRKNIRETQRALDVSLKAFETGLVDYDRIINLLLQKIKYQLIALQATKNAFINKAKIEYLTN